MWPFVDLDHWTIDSIRVRLSGSAGEEGWFDWKEMLRNRHDPKHNRRLCETTCGMANTGDGGFLIFGVADRGETPETRIVGVPLDGEEAHHFGQVVEKIRPNVRFTSKTIEMREGHGIFIVHVSESKIRPHMNQWDGIFYQRGDGGNVKPMEYQQVRDLMVLGEDRRQKVTLLMAKIAQYWRLADRLEMSAGNAHQCFDRFDTTFFDALLVDVWGVLPADWLVQRLMDISEIANRMNNLLDHVAAPTGNFAERGVYPNEVLSLQGDAGTIKREGSESLQRLEQLFEPLPPGLRYGVG